MPEARIAVAHGQMDEGTLEQVVVDFWEGGYDVLVCTTIIESGIDMPTVNTLVVERSDLLGLGQLHQLRGRVGRSGQRAYAYLFHPADRVLTEEAYERLRTIGEATELGSGFKIAMRDLEIRGAGNLLGENQSGHIAAVGYDLYVQMVNEAVAEMKGEAPRPPAEVKLDVPTDAFLPLDYVTKEELRLEAYRRLAAVTDHAEVDDIAAEWEDRYGPVPEAAANLLAVGHLRAECFRLGIRDVSITSTGARLAPVELRTSEAMRLRRVARHAIYKEAQQQLVLPLERAEDPTRQLLAVLGELFPDDGGRQEAAAPGEGRVAGVTRTPAGAGAGALALSLCASLAVSSCGTVPARAATVNGSAITRSDFERDLQALAANPAFFNITGGTEVSIEGDAARSWLSQVITWRAAEELLADHGLEPSQESVADLNSQVAASEDAQRLPESMKDEIVRGVAAVQSLPLIPAPSPSDLEAQYAVEPAGTGALCLRHIVVETEAEARAVLAELDAGADFAELAMERSIEPAAAETGGALAGGDGNACLPVSDYQTGFDPAFTEGALAATAGVPTDPVQSEFGWHVILVRPYDEVADDLLTLVSTAPGDAALTGELATADVSVDPRYGRWDPVRGDVVSLR